MNKLQIISIGLLCSLLIYQIWVSTKIWRSDQYDSKQRVLQLLIIWLLPLIGAVVCHSIVRNDDQKIQRADLDFVPQSPNETGTNL